MPKLKILYPVRATEFRRPGRQPLIEIADTRGSYRMYASYSTQLNCYDETNVWFIEMPHGIKMNQIRAIMRAIRPAVENLILVRNSRNLAVMMGARVMLNNAVANAIRDYVKATNNV